MLDLVHCVPLDEYNCLRRLIPNGLCPFTELIYVFYSFSCSLLILMSPIFVVMCNNVKNAGSILDLSKFHNREAMQLLVHK